MIRFVAGLMLGLMAGASFANTYLMDAMGRVTQIASAPVPDVAIQMAPAVALMTAFTPSGKASIIRVDEDGYVIVSSERRP